MTGSTLPIGKFRFISGNRPAQQKSSILPGALIKYRGLPFFFDQPVDLPQEKLLAD
jgi:hypothetical protein